MLTSEILISVCGDGRGHYKREVVSSRGVHRRPASLQGTEVGHQVIMSADVPHSSQFW